VIEKIDDKTTKVIYISHIDLKGSIPSFVKNIISGEQGEVVGRIAEAMKKGGY